MGKKGKLNIAFDGDVEMCIHKTPDSQFPHHQNAQTQEEPSPQPQQQQELPHAQRPTSKKEKQTKQQDEKDGKKRQEWGSKIEFLMSCLSLTIGFGNIWRFPFVALENGGGAFLFAYILVVLFIGRPLYYLELFLGQFPSRGPANVWAMLPAFRGVGYGQIVVNWIVSTYYVFLMAMCAFYFFASFSTELPWSYCGTWTTDKCVDSYTSTTLTGIVNGTSAAEEYLTNEVLKVDALGFGRGVGLPDIRLCMCLVVSWTAIFTGAVHGVKTTGKVVYVTALFPYLVLFIMLIRGATLPGAFTGIMFLLKPHWEKLLDIQVWYAAFSQAFYSMAIGYGTLITLASFNTFHNDIYYDSLIITLADCATSILAGITTFGIVGHMADMLGVEVSAVIKGGGTTLVFISYPEVLATFTFVPQLFSALFFLMMFMIGLGSSLGINSVLTTTIKEKFPDCDDWKVTMLVCLLGLLCSIIYTTPQGQYIFTLVNYYSAGLPVLGLVLLEVVGVAWVYGISRLDLDLHFMVNRSIGPFWKMTWGLLLPVLIACVLVYGQMQPYTLTYGTYVFGNIGTIVEVIIAVVPLVLVPCVFGIELIASCKSSATPGAALRATFLPNSSWGPNDETLRQKYITKIEEMHTVNRRDDS